MGFFPYVVKHGITEAIGSELVRVISPHSTCILTSSISDTGASTSIDSTSSTNSTTGPTVDACGSHCEQTQVSCAPFMDTLWFCFGASAFCHTVPVHAMELRDRG